MRSAPGGLQSGAEESRLYTGEDREEIADSATHAISTGDPVVPPPQLVKVSRVLGDDIELSGYAPETTVAEKGVTILERGTTSTRWRDYVDTVQLAEHHHLDETELRRSARAVARYRNVELGPIAPMVEGYGPVGPVKWAAWRRKERVEEISEERLEDQMVKVIAFLEPVLANGSDERLCEDSELTRAVQEPSQQPVSGLGSATR